MLTVEEFDSLEVGDQIETAPLLPALTDDSVVVRTVLAEDGVREFAATFCGITVARWKCQKVEGVLQWQV